MTIDNNGNVCIGKNLADNVTYYKNVLINGINTRIPYTNQTRFDVKGVSKFDDIIIYDDFTNNYKHIDDVYIRANGGGSIRPSQISAGIFNGLSYSFNIVDIRETLNAKNINTTGILSSENINVNNLLVSENAVFRGTTSFVNTSTLSMNRLEIANDLVIGGIRVNPINISDETLGYTTLSSTSSTNGNKYFFTYVVPRSDTTGQRRVGDVDGGVANETSESWTLRLSSSARRCCGVRCRKVRLMRRPFRAHPYPPSVSRMHTHHPFPRVAPWAGMR
jgi:hypothetical protein